MGTGEESSPAKSSKPTASSQEAPTTPLYPDWSASMQAYYGAGATPPPFFASPVASPAHHPYLWGTQHTMVPPYGTPLPYPALYPHGGLYAHSNVAMGAALTNTEIEGKVPNGKDSGSIKKSKGAPGSTGLTSGKSGESEKAASASGNDGASQSGESSSEGLSEASDDNGNQQASSAAKKRSFDQMLTDGGNAKRKAAVQYNGENPPASVQGKPVPGTNLNIGMDLWNASPVGATPMKMRPNASSASPLVASAPMVGREGILHDHQLYVDERELKREKRKQSNRESARRSRLRKQAECEELQAKVEKLNDENQILRQEMSRLAEECKQLTSENNSIMEELTRIYGHEAISEIQNSFQNAAFQPVNGKDHRLEQDTSTETNSNTTSAQNG